MYLLLIVLDYPKATKATMILGCMGDELLMEVGSILAVTSMYVLSSQLVADKPNLIKELHVHIYKDLFEAYIV
jgi:hypothetical protein